jgi:hypothetical protein
VLQLEDELVLGMMGNSRTSCELQSCGLKLQVQPSMTQLSSAKHAEFSTRTEVHTA